VSIQHKSRHAPDNDEPWVFASLGDFTCSICAPNMMEKNDVESYADSIFPGKPWRSINKANFGLGGQTPNPCNDAPDKRTHWFMFRES